MSIKYQFTGNLHAHHVTVIYWNPGNLYIAPIPGIRTKEVEYSPCKSPIVTHLEMANNMFPFEHSNSKSIVYVFWFTACLELLRYYWIPF